MLHQLHSHPQFTHRFFLYVSQISDRLHRFAMPNHTSSFPFLPPFLTARLVSMLWHHAASSTCRRHSSELLSLKQTVLASRCIKDQFGSSAMYQLFNMKNDLKFMSELSRSQGCSFLSQSGSDIKKQSFSHEAHSKTNFASDSVVQLSWSCKILQVATSFSMSQLVFQHDRTPELSSPVEAEAFAILQVVHEFCLWRILYYLYVYDNIHKYIYIDIHIFDMSLMVFPLRWELLLPSLSRTRLCMVEAPTCTVHTVGMFVSIRKKQEKHWKTWIYVAVSFVIILDYLDSCAFFAVV